MFGRLIVSPPEMGGVPGCMLVMQAYPSATQTSLTPESDPAFSPNNGPRTTRGHTLYVRTQQMVFYFCV